MQKNSQKVDFRNATINGKPMQYIKIMRHVQHSLFQDKRISHTSKLVFLTLHDFAAVRDQATVTWSNDWLAKFMKMSVKTIQRAIAELRAAGYLNGNTLIMPQGHEKHEIKTDNNIVTWNTGNNITKVNTLTTRNTADESRPQAMHQGNDVTTFGNIGNATNGNKGTTVTTDNKDTTITTVSTVTTGNNAANEQQQASAREVAKIMAASLLGLVTGKITKEQMEELSQQHLPPCPSEQDISVSVADNFVQQAGTKMSPITIQETNKKKEQSRSVHASLSDVGCSELASQSEANRKIAELASAKSARKGFDPIRYAAAALTRMKASKQDMERYLSELAYSFTQGCYANSENPLRAIRGALRKIEDGYWKAPAGMYG